MTDITTYSSQPFLDGLFFGECPRWHEGRLWFSDFFDHTVFSAAPDGARRPEVTVDGEPAGIGWLPDGRLLVASRHDRAVLRLEADGTLVRHGGLEPWATYHANDMVVSADGRAYVGNFGFDLDAFMSGDSGTAPHNTSLVRVDPDGSAHQAAEDLAFPNGTVITPDGRTLIVAESLGFRLSAFDVAADGSLSGRRIWAELPGIAPDGICLDAEGCVWVANAVAPECLRVAEGGEIVARVGTTQICFACMLGADDRTTLFVVTAPTSVAREAAAGRHGRIESVRVEVPGAGLP